MRLVVKLVGFQAFPNVQRDLVDGSLEVELPDDATADGLLAHLSEKYGTLFKRGGAVGGTRLNMFIDNDMIDELQIPLASRLRPRSAITVSLLRPLRGG